VRIGGSGLDLSSSENGQVAGFLEHRNESLGSTKLGEFFRSPLTSEGRIFCTNIITPRMRKDRFI
jgi:hypothetical protein